MPEKTATELFDEWAAKLELVPPELERLIDRHRDLLEALEEHVKLHPPNRKRATCGLCKALAVERTRIQEAQDE